MLLFVHKKKFLTLSIFISGATGYIGGAICRALADASIPVLAGLRRPTSLPGNQTPFVTGDLAAAGLTLPPITAVIHAAGLGHRRGVPAAAWRAANITAAVTLARAAQAAGASKFILISTAHIHGRTHPGTVTDDTPANPMDGYAASKLQAEHEVAAVLGPALTIIRPVAVIGPRCPGNLQLLMKLLVAGVPLPFAAIRNRRSFIDVTDLAALVLAALHAPSPPPVILAAHPEPIATPDLIATLATGLARPARLLPLPASLLGLAATLAGRAAMWQSLAGSFAAAPTAALALGWRPRQTVPESLTQTARYYNTTIGTP